MFEELKPVFKETLKSAEEYHRLKHLLFNTHSKTSKKRLTPNDNINSSSYDIGQELRESQRKLIDYLMKQNYEIFKTIYTIMWLGEYDDYDYIKDPKEMYETMYESSPFYLIREREINLEKEIYTMVRKWTFPIQFREGLKKLKIKL
jgi:hypothetical protein